MKIILYIIPDIIARKIPIKILRSAYLLVKLRQSKLAIRLVIVTIPLKKYNPVIMIIKIHKSNIKVVAIVGSCLKRAIKPKIIAEIIPGTMSIRKNLMKSIKSPSILYILSLLYIMRMVCIMLLFCRNL